MKFDRISIDSSICHGQACVKGTRMPVNQIVRMLVTATQSTICWSNIPFCPARTSWLVLTTPLAWPRSRSRRSRSPTSSGCVLS
jgi:hypothetical protein